MQYVTCEKCNFDEEESTLEILVLEKLLLKRFLLKSPTLTNILQPWCHPLCVVVVHTKFV